MAIQFNRNIMPPCGRLYIERDGTRFRGDSWKDLEAKVAGYRKRRGWPEGNVREDIDSQICAQYPNFCGDNTPRPVQNSHSMSFNQRVLQWLAHAIGLKRSNPKLFTKVTDEVAAQRAAICARCPKQHPLVKSCEACIRNVALGRKALLDNVPSKHQNLLPCAVLAEDPAITVHLNQIPVNSNELPAGCWRKA